MPVARPYACPACSVDFTKWLLCKKHFVASASCRTEVEHLTPDQLQTACRKRDMNGTQSVKKLTHGRFTMPSFPSGANKPEMPRSKIVGSVMSRTLLIAYFPWEAAREDVFNVFSQHASVESVELIMDKETRKPKCYGFVEFTTHEDACKALEATRQKLVKLTDQRGHVWTITSEFKRAFVEQQQRQFQPPPLPSPVVYETYEPPFESYRREWNREGNEHFKRIWPQSMFNYPGEPSNEVSQTWTDHSHDLLPFARQSVSTETTCSSARSDEGTEKEPVRNKNLCWGCQEKRQCAILIPCGHQLFCKECGEDVQQCPHCKESCHGVFNAKLVD